MGPRGPDLGDPLVDPQLDAGEHWQATRKLAHPLARQRQLEPGLEAVLELYHILGPELLRIRAEVLEDIEELIFELHDQTEEWMATRPARVRQTLTTPTKARPTQVPLFLHLLELIGYEDTAGLRSDFEEGFAMLGNIRRTRMDAQGRRSLRLANQPSAPDGAEQAVCEHESKTGASVTSQRHSA